jgi:hypothetical protein
MHRLLLIQSVCLAVLCQGCGAPTKSAGEVASLFARSSKSLQDKVSELCKALQIRDEIPTLKNLSLETDNCKSAGLWALDYKKIDTFVFSGVDDVSPKKNDKIIHLGTRSQVWLNRSLLEFAASVSSLMKKKSSEASAGAIALPDSGDGKLSGLATTTMTQLGQPMFNLDTLKFNTKINFKLSGIVTADHDLTIDGQLIDDAFAVTVKTTEDKTLKQSVMKDFRVLVLVIPHAGDVYLDMFVDLNAHNVGLETVFREQLKAALGSGLKGVIDSFMQL